MKMKTILPTLQTTNSLNNFTNEIANQTIQKFSELINFEENADVDTYIYINNDYNFY